MKKVLLISTGGTIASTMTERGLSSTLSGDDIVRVAAIDTDTLDLNIKNLFNIDSSLIQPEDWARIADEIVRCSDYYDGFIITHGTDTMAYTASMISYMIGSIDKPIIVTGSMKSVQEPETDAIDNLKDAFTAVREPIGGVYVVFKHKLISGIRSSKLNSVEHDAFVSVNTPVVAHINGGHVSYKVKKPYDGKGLNACITFDPQIVVLKMFPGLNPDIMEQMYESGYRGIVLEGYGTGGMPYRHRDIATKVNEIADKIPILLTTQVMYNGVCLESYEVGQKAIETGVISARDMSKEASITKLMWALGQSPNPEKVKDIMYTNYLGEITINVGI